MPTARDGRAVVREQGNPPVPKWGRLAVLALIVAVGAALRVWGIAFGLPHDLARPDEEKIAYAVFGILHGDFNPHFFLYPVSSFT